MKNFSIELLEAYTESLSLRIESNDKEVYFVRGIVRTSDFLRNEPKDFALSCYHHYDETTFPEYAYKGHLLYNAIDLYPGTEYTVFVYPTTNYYVDGPENIEYATFRTKDIPYEQVPSTYEITNATMKWERRVVPTLDPVRIIGEDAEKNITFSLHLNAFHLLRDFNDEDLYMRIFEKNYSYVTDGDEKSEITHINLQGRMDDATTEYILSGWVKTLNGKQYSIKLHVPTLLPGKFTVNSSGKKVQFACGNLFYHTGYQAWRFATSQDDAISNFKTSSESGWMDLFGWGTGASPAKFSNNDLDYTRWTDWGTNIIDNGSARGNEWRTLTHDEWNYLLYERPQASSLFSVVKIGRPGIILLPDGWVDPNSGTGRIKTAKQLGFTWDNTLQRWSGPDNAINQNANFDGEGSSWKRLQAAGAVFLPIGGFREGTEVQSHSASDDPMGCYWTSTVYPNTSVLKNGAYCLIFRTNEVLLDWADPVHFGYNVRLVKDVQ